MKGLLLGEVSYLQIYHLLSSSTSSSTMEASRDIGGYRENHRLMICDWVSFYVVLEFLHSALHQHNISFHIALDLHLKYALKHFHYNHLGFVLTHLSMTLVCILNILAHSNLRHT